MYVSRRGLGDDTTAAGFDLSQFPVVAQSFLSSPINLGPNTGTVPLWAAGAVAVVGYMLLSAIGRGAKRVGGKVSTRAKKIRKGFTS